MGQVHPTTRRDVINILRDHTAVEAEVGLILGSNQNSDRTCKFDAYTIRTYKKENI